MTSFLYRLLQFSVFLCIFYIGAIIVWGEFMPTAIQKNLNYRLGYGGHLHTRAREVTNYSDIDLLFLGSSHTYRGFDTRIFEASGYTSFNLGSSSQSPLQTLYFLKRHIDQLNPATVIMEVYPDNFISDGVESSLDFAANLPWHTDLIAMAAEVNHIKTWNTLLFATWRHFSKQNKDFIQPGDQWPNYYIPGGYVERAPATFSPASFHPELNRNWKMNPLQINAFQRIIELLKEKNIKLILVQSPVTVKAYQSYNNNSEMDSFFKATNHPYINFNSMRLMNDSLHFYDADHLNHLGVQRFNKALLNILQDLIDK